MKKIFLLLSLFTLFAFVDISPVSNANKQVICPMGMLMTASAAAPMQETLAAQAQKMGYDNASEFQEQAPQTPTDPNDPNFNGNPGDPEPKEACTPYNRPDGKLPCTCLKQDPQGCKAGERQTEHRVCNSYCWKKYCHCCKS